MLTETLIETTADPAHSDEARTAGDIARVAAELVSAGADTAAADQCKALLLAADLDLHTIDVGIWAALTAKRSDVALELARAAVRLVPNDAGRHRAVAALLSSNGDFDEAVAFASRACVLAPDDADHACFLGVLCNEAGRYTDAVAALLPAIRLGPGNAEAYHHLAYASLKLDRVDLAATLASRAFELDRLNPARALFAAHLLGQTRQYDDAIELLRETSAAGHDTHHLRRSLCAMLTEAGELSAAVSEIEEALRLAPDEAEYHLQRSSLLFRLGNFAGAAQAIDFVLLNDPDNLSVKRHAVTLYLEGGRFESAVATTADLLRRAPEEDEYAKCMLHVLSQRMEAATPLPGILERKRSAPPRPPRATPSFFDGMQTQGRVIAALLLREMRTRFGESRLGYFWVLLEMVIHLGVLAVVFQFTMHGTPPIGHSFFFFYFTGLTPYLLYVHTCEHAGMAILHNKPMLQLPMVTHVDCILARALLELVTQVVITLLFVGGFLVCGVDAVPHDYGQAALAILAAWMLGLGMGSINSVANVFFHAWHHVMSVMLRVLYFASGIFYVPGLMPVQVRQIVAWNPLMHCVDWFRTAFFASYEPIWLDRTYPVLVGLILVTIGFLLEAAFRRKLRQPL